MLSTQGVDLIVKTTTAATISATAVSDHRHQRPLYNISNSNNNNHSNENTYSHKFNRTNNNQLSSYHQIPENFETYFDLNNTTVEERFQSDDLLIEQEESLFIPCTDTIEFDDLEKTTMSNSTQVSVPPVQFLQTNTFGELVMSGSGQINESMMNNNNNHHHHHELSHHHQLWSHSVRLFLIVKNRFYFN